MPQSMEDEEFLTAWGSNSMVSVTMGRVMTTLLTTRPKKLHDSITHLSSSPKPIPAAVTLEDALWVLHKYVKDAAEEKSSLDEVLIPMIENSLKCKEAKHRNQEMILLNWLFQDELLFHAVARNFSNILFRKDDHHIALGWCILARGLIEFEVTMKQFPTSGIKERYNALLKSICSCTSHLLSIVNNRSKLLDGFELPTRLSVAAADCIIALSVALTRKEAVSDKSEKKTKTSIPFVKPLQDSQSTPAINQGGVKASNKSSELSSNLDLRSMLWAILDELVMLMQRLIAWSKKSRTLHAKGLERVLKWLKETKEQADPLNSNTGILLLSSCWKHYGILLHLEDRQSSRHHNELLEQYLSGIQFYADNYTEEPTVNKDGGLETINFFLNCLLLLLGRFSAKQFESAMTEHKLQISRVVTSQLYSVDENVIDGAISIFKATLFGAGCSASSCSLRETRQMDVALPLLLNLLDERDGIARAVVTLVAEYCSINSDSHCLEEVLRRLATGNAVSRRNAIDVVSELIHISVDSVSVLPPSTWQNIAKHLLDCLGDEELAVQAKAANLIPMIDPSFSMPALVRLVCSSDDISRSSASNALLEVLKCHSKADVICMLLDCLSNFNESIHLAGPEGNRIEGSKLDLDRVLKLISEWSKHVKDWTSLVGPLVDKMFAEPSNAIIVRFLSCVSEHLAGSADAVFERVMLHANGNREIDESCINELANGTGTGGDGKLQQSLFDRLCPLLIIRLLPLRVFNDLKSTIVYGELVYQQLELDSKLINIKNSKSIAELLLERAFDKCEFEDVRKLSAELCGRIHPQILIPILSSQLEYAAHVHDIMKIKTCLFSICTSLVVRGRDSVCHGAMPSIRKSIERILLWPSVDGDEISKAQHGCIDCLALMLCTELQDQKVFKNSASKTANAAGNTAVYTYVIDQLTGDRNEVMSMDNNSLSKGTNTLPFRLCMANVLISACQKISDSGRKRFVKKIVPPLIRSIKEVEIRVACIQVLFSVVYHLKSAVLPYSSDLLKASLMSLKGATEKERMAGGKLLAALMASEESVIESISEGLLEARVLLSSMSLNDSSSDVRQLCKKLLLCMTSQ